MSTRASVRWWPALAVAALAVAALVWVQLDGDFTGQDRFMLSVLVAVATLSLLLLWLLFFSRLPWRKRLAGLAAVVLVGLGASQLLSVRGVTGDLVPILGWRWSAPPEEELVAELPEATPEPETVPATPPPEVPEPEAAEPAETAETAPAAGALPAAAAPEPPAPAPPPSPGDYPQFLGPGRNAVLPGPRLARDWSGQPPREIWRRPIGAGWSAFAVAGGRAVTQEQRGPEELVTAYDLATGELLWAHADTARYDTTIAGAGPRSTPTIHGGRVYTVGGTGLLNALDLATGRELWEHDLHAEHGATTPEWGKTCSPLVVDGLVVVSAGGSGGRSLVAYDAETGELAWAAGSDRSSYSSPLLTTLAGRRQIVIFNRASVAGHDPATGEVLWEHPFSDQQPNVAQPLVLPGDHLLLSAGYGVGSKLLRIAGNGGGLAPEVLWESPRLKAKFTNVVLHEGYVYGLDDGTLVCLDPATGERCWKRGRYGHGQVILVGDLLLIQAENGDVALVEPSPEELRELARFTAFSSKTWNPPTLAGRRLLVRNDREAAAYDLPLAE